MASVCEICGKKPNFGMNVSHSHRRTKRRWNPNIQRVRALVGGTPHPCQRMHRMSAFGQDPKARTSQRQRLVSATSARAGAATPWDQVSGLATSGARRHERRHQSRAARVGPD